MEETQENPKELRYTKEHEWIHVEDGVGTVGITFFAQHALTDVVFVEMPEVGTEVVQFKPVTTIESVKSVSDIYAPVSGEIVEVNKELESQPELVNNEPYKGGWIYKLKVKDESEINDLMYADQYTEHTKKQDH